MELETLYEEHGPDLLRYLMRSHGNEEAEDLLQETFAQAIARPQRMKAACSARAWLFGIARNLSLNTHRRRKPTTSLPDGLTQDKPDEDERLEDVRTAIGQLPDEQREALTLRLVEQLSYEEIAQVQGIPLGTVRSRIHHAVRKLRTELLD